MLLELEILPPQNINEDDLDILTNSVNRQRLSNNPVRLNKGTIKLYKEILEIADGEEN